MTLDLGLKGPPAHVERAQRTFRKEIVPLGFAWILLGFLTTGMGFWFTFMTGTTEHVEVARIVFIIFGVVWIGLGAFTCLKKTWAIQGGLYFSYATLLMHLVTLSVVVLVLTAIVIAQAHRVLFAAHTIQKAGWPL